MPSTNFTATDRRDLLNQLYTFATTNGWTGQYNDAVANGQIALSRGNCLIAIGEEGTQTSFTDSGGTLVQLEEIRFGLNTAFTASQVYNGHTRGDNNLGAAVANFPFIDDVVGNTTVYLFTDSASTPTYIHGFVRASDGLRWSGFSFGLLNKLDFSVPDVAYVATNRYIWWFSSADPSQPAAEGNSPSDADHDFIGDFDAYNVRIPSGVLDTAIGFPAGDNVFSDLTSNVNNLNTFRLDPLEVLDRREETGSIGFEGILNGYLNTQNQNLTGGAALWAIPVLMRETASDFRTYIGEIPDMRLCDMGSFGPLQTFQQGSDNWQAFPWARPGLEINTNSGAQPTLVTNSSFYGQAVKVVP